LVDELYKKTGAQVCSEWCHNRGLIGPLLLQTLPCGFAQYRGNDCAPIGHEQHTGICELRPLRV